MAEYVFRYTVMVGTKLSRKLQTISAPNDCVARQKARRAWERIKQWAEKGIVPIMVTVRSPRLFRNNEPIRIRFDDGG